MNFGYDRQNTFSTGRICSLNSAMRPISNRHFVNFRNRKPTKTCWGICFLTKVCCRPNQEMPQRTKRFESSFNSFRSIHKPDAAHLIQAETRMTGATA